MDEPTSKTETECLHHDVDYSVEHDNYYCRVCRKGMGHVYHRDMRAAEARIESLQKTVCEWVAEVEARVESLSLAERLQVETEAELDEVTGDILELALDLDAWDGGDEEHNGRCADKMLENIRRKLGVPHYFGEWILAQNEAKDLIGVVARFLKGHADADSLKRGGGMFPDVSHVRAFLLEHGRTHWAEDTLPIAEKRYETRHALKLERLVNEYYADDDDDDDLERCAP